MSSCRPGLFGNALPQGRRRAARGGEVDITPMIDVTFLLLIFFMLTSTMKGTPEVDVPPAVHGSGVESLRSAVIGIRTGGPQPTVVLGEGSSRIVDATPEDVRAFVEEHVRDGRPHVIIKADRDVQHGVVQEVARTIRGIPGATFYIGVQDRRGGPLQE